MQMTVPTLTLTRSWNLIQPPAQHVGQLGLEDGGRI
jgi:hypothetical protein